MVNSFSIYKEYYELITLLPEKEQKELSLVIFKYMFDDVEPSLSGNIAKVFNNLKRPLDKAKNRSKNGSNTKTKNNQNENKTKSKQNQNENKTKSKNNQIENKTKTHQDGYGYVYVYGNVNGILELINNCNNIKNNELIKAKILEWLEYKTQRKDKYTEKGLKSLITKLDNLLDLYDSKILAELIDNSIVNNWKGIIWDNLRNKQQIKANVSTPSWFNKNNVIEESTKEELEEMENLLSEFKQSEVMHEKQI